MFSSKTVNPYEAVVAKATDEKQTDANWDILLTVWDKVNEDGEQGQNVNTNFLRITRRARNCVAALQKRFVHRSANVHLFSLTLAGALVNNCGPPLHREISSKAFTGALTRLITDRSTHESVKTSALSLIQAWVKEHPNNPDFDILVETYEQLKRQGQKFPSDKPEPKPDRSRTDEALRREEEELQRALEESARLAGVGNSGGGPGRAQDYESKALPRQPSTNGLHEAYQSHASTSTSSLPPPRLPQRARAMYDFAGGQSPEELPFHKGDIIRVIDSPYNDWWRGELRGATGIFPRTYVVSLCEVELPDTPVAPPSSQSSEAELEAELFAQSANIDRLLNMMRTLSSRGENVAENEELGELYNELMTLRPKVVSLIKKYDQKGAELRSMNDKFGRAKMTYEGMVGYGHPSQSPHGNPQQQQGQGQYGGYPDPRHQQQQQPHPSYGVPGTQGHQQHPQQQHQSNFAQQRQHEEEMARKEADARAQREYETQMAQYEKEMAAWRAAQEQSQQSSYYPSQDYQPQQQYAPTPNHDPAYPQPHPQQYDAPAQHGAHGFEPPPAAASTQQWAAQTPSHQQAPVLAPSADPNQPVWDGSQWVYPRQHVVAEASPAAGPTQTYVSAPVPSPAPISSPSPTVAAVAPQMGYPAQSQSYPAQPYPATMAPYSASAPVPTQSPPPPTSNYAMSTTSSIYTAQSQPLNSFSQTLTPSTTATPGALVDRMASLSVSTPPTHEPQPQTSSASSLVSADTIRHQLYDRPMASSTTYADPNAAVASSHAVSPPSTAVAPAQVYYPGPVGAVAAQPLEAGAPAAVENNAEAGADDAAWQEYYRKKAEWDQQQAQAQAAAAMAVVGVPPQVSGSGLPQQA
ncbi:BQ5605_C021g09307 [Microbotryum silenes-dioicae]|uniref:Class E vacuolar protein-sorting machinery protein HSE1 n=1 Tax=Microbotryum silenes-dioicae TaxID=796604 RepID=A0A2X0MNI0_9BASI|nr:BQ5605_C021g09307 [Microbotryum silenes-dioicae]